MKPLRIGTRGSALALAQANQVKAVLEKAHPDLRAELVVIRTTGDRQNEAAQQGAPEGGAPAGEALKGLFVKELEEALLDGRIDLAVHSAKDMETDLPEGLTLAAVPVREEARDALVVRAGAEAAGLQALPTGARVGVSSIRRQAQIRRVRTDLELVPIRGNVDTRLRKLDKGEVDALVVAACGLIRLGRAERIALCLEPEQMLPAPGQGALALESRADLIEWLKGIDDPEARDEVLAERAFLRALGGNCRVPVGALARARGSHLTVVGAVLSPDGRRRVWKEVTGSRAAAERLGGELASHVRAAGADRLLYGTRHFSAPKGPAPFGGSGGLAP